MKAIIAILALVAVNQAEAQNGANLQGDTQADPRVELQAGSSGSGNPIYILNNQKLQGYQGATQGTNQQAGQQAIQEQPVSVVQEAPLRPSAADNMRRRRQETESATEDGIVQALERARMDDEIRRRDRFNNAIAPAASNSASANVVGDNNNVQQTQVVQQPIQQVVPVPVVVPKQKKEVIEDEGDDLEVIEEETKPVKKKVDIRNEIRAAIAETTKKPEPQQSYYVGGLASFGNYDNVINVNRSMGWGVAIGTVTAERIVAEGSFVYSNFQLENMYEGIYTSGGFYPIIVDMRQYNVSAAVKYQLLPGKFRPNAGVVLSYTRRNYSWYDYELLTTDAVDVGAAAGADLQFTDSLAIGLDFRYMTNLGYKKNTNRQESFVYAQRRNDPETLDYYMVNLIGKFTF